MQIIRQAARAGCDEQLLSRKQTPDDDGERAQRHSLSVSLSLWLTELKLLRSQIN